MSPRVTEEHKNQRRQEILQAATEVFKRKGFESTTMKDIVEACGMSRGGVYMYFSSTDEMFRAILDQNDDTSASEHYQIREGETAWEALLRGLDDFEKDLYHLDDTLVPLKVEYFTAIYREQGRQPYQLGRYQKMAAAYQSFLATGVERGEFHPQKPLESICLSVISFMDGIVLTTLQLGPEHTDVNGQVDHLRFYLEQVLRVNKVPSK
ncbi:TetR family transcriptional regulator [Brevibacillus dissolubilis]|uniref:TetR family transcriptional regulator n=1 Tax=Brevibacillus dissolubilis TaxID=1844116 RepID=UPI00159BD0E6|nr:TetR family transcriptional regulator [Brevibacillus dissolubilis]